jgi:hypothetical protein
MKKFLSCLIVGISLLFAGCSRTYESPSSYTIMEKDDVIKFIVETNRVEVMSNFILGNDALYAVPTLEWVKEHYTPNFKKFLFDNNLQTQLVSGYSTNSNDCDKFSTYALTVGHLMHEKGQNRPRNAALTIGEVYYMQPMQDHAINFWLATDNGVLGLYFYEPQKQDFVPLKPRDTIFTFVKI